MKYTIAIIALLGMAAANEEKPDPRAGTSAMPVPHAAVGALAKPTKGFSVPKNKDAEPALSTTLDPYDYGSGSGKTYHDKTKGKKNEELKKPDTPAGMEESTETAGTTNLWKVNAGDSPEAEKKKEKDDSDAFVQMFDLHPSAPVANSLIQTESELAAGCEPAIDVSQKQLDIELDYFSRGFDRKHYKKAMQVYKELKKQGKDPKVSIHTWELYDAAFSFPRVRRYDLVQKHMDLLQHFQDNLNQNFTNQLHLDNFLRVAKNAQEALNEKYHNGEFSDPANFDPEADHPVTWATANI